MPKQKTGAGNVVVVLLVLFAGIGICPANIPPAQAAQQAPAQDAAAKPVGTVKAIAGNTITLTTDAGSDVNVIVQATTRLLWIAPGQKDMKDAMPLQLQDVQPGDRILVRGRLAEDGKSVLATSVIAMKQSDIAEKQKREREAWQRHGVGGLVSAVDAASGTITIAVSAMGASRNVAIHVSKNTVLRRYAPESVKFDDAKPGTLEQIKSGDQLRARGARSADGSELAADEIVSGSFRNIAGTIVSLDASAAALSVMDLVSKKTVLVKITADSAIRRLPPPMAQRIAMRIKGVPADAAAPAAASKPGEPPARGPGEGRPSGAPDLQQVINRLPPATLAEFQKGDAVMLVSTQGSQSGEVTAITLLGGVEPVLEAASKGGQSMVLSPWSIGGSNSEAATP
jgi:hypothetical protein